MSLISCDTRSDSGFLDEDGEKDCVPMMKNCTVDDIACFIREVHIGDSSYHGNIHNRMSPWGSLESFASTLSAARSEDRKSTLKSASSYKQMPWIDSNREGISETENKTNVICDEGNVDLKRKVKTRKQSNEAKTSERCKSSPVKRTVCIDVPDGQHERPLSDSQKKKTHTNHLNSQYDSRLERSKSFLHGQSKVFSKASQFLTPAKPGLQKLQVCYSKTNMELNSGKIFGDLIKTAHKQNIVISDSVHSIERRLLRKRTDPTKKTSYFKNMNKPDPFRAVSKPKKAQTVAEKQKERKERIAETTEEMKLGFKRTAKTVKLLTPAEVEKLKSCRYLRIDPVIQLQLEEYDK